MLYDKDIREPLFDYFEQAFGKVRVIEEKRMGRSRADIVLVLEDGICGVEIKSDADTYVRLHRQVEDYEQYFDRNYVVVGSTHAIGVREHVPAHWGILSVEKEDGRVDFYVVQKASRNPNMELEKKISLLWRPELAHIQELNRIPAYKQKSKAFVVAAIAACVPDTIPEVVLAHQISEELFERDYQTIADRINEYRVANGRKKRRKTKKRIRKF